MTLRKYTLLVAELCLGMNEIQGHCISCEGKLKDTVTQFLQQELGAAFLAFVEEYNKRCGGLPKFNEAAGYWHCRCVYLEFALETLAVACPPTSK